MQCITVEDLPPPPREKSGWPWTEKSPGISAFEPVGSFWPKISIITPSLNHGRFIEETIRSVLLQSYPNLEYIVIDGASQDETMELIRKYSPWITHWVSEPDQGQAEAINKGFRKATGDIMGWLNSDDTYTPDAIWRVARYFIEHRDINMVYGEAWYVNESSDRLTPCRQVRETFSKHYLINVDPIVQPATFWSRNLWLRIGELDSRFNWGFDWEFFIRAYLHTEMRYLPEFLANYRLHDQNKTLTGGEARQAELARITRLYGRWWYPTNAVYQSSRPWYFMRRLTSRWPIIIAKPLRFISVVPLSILARLVAGKFMS